VGNEALFADELVALVFGAYVLLEKVVLGAVLE